MIQSRYDVIVAGGGTAGFAAAIAAGRNGARTLLVEKNGYLGGTSTMGIPFLGVFDGNGRQVARGILEEVVQRLVKEGGSIGHVHGARWSNKGHMEGDAFTLTPFDSEIFKYVAQEMVLEAGVDMLLHTWIADVTMQGSKVTGLVVLNKSGTHTIESDIIIDATGDADVCAYAGAEMVKKPHVQNSSILFVVNNVDTEKLFTGLQQGENLDGWGWWHSRVVKAVKLGGNIPSHIHIAGHFKPFEDDSIVTFTAVSGRQGEVYLNATRTVNIDATDAESLTFGEISERRNIKRLMDGLTKRIPGFENAYVSRTAELGIRESRSVVGDYILTGEDVFNSRLFEDVIARGAYPSDIHDPKGGKTQFTFIKDGGSYGIPYRCLIPKDLEGLLVAGRSISATQDANGTVRLQGTVIAQGQAAGTAAALAAQGKFSVRLVPIGVLQRKLTEQGAEL
jgi:ribulose 1,5-bisphosphate synthetase/thiazole synthase